MDPKHGTYQNQTKRLNRILDNIIKRILNLPQSTPRECLYYELGTLDIEHRIITKRINYATTLLIKNPENLRDILQTTNPKSWIQKTIQQARSAGLDLDTLRHISAKDRKVSVKEPITKSMNDKHNTEGQNKSKFKFLTTNSETRRNLCKTLLSIQTTQGCQFLPSRFLPLRQKQLLPEWQKQVSANIFAEMAETQNMIFLKSVVCL